MSLADYEIGTAIESMVNIEQIYNGETLLPPVVTVQHYDEVVPLASGAARGLGGGVIRWTFPYISINQRAAFRALCAGASASLYINSIGLDGSSTYYTYACICKWPESESRDNSRGYHNFQLEFSSLVLVGD